jgi:hypothetical protein
METSNRQLWTNDLKELTSQVNTIAQTVPELEASYSNMAGLLF